MANLAQCFGIAILFCELALMVNSNAKWLQNRDNCAYFQRF